MAIPDYVTDSRDIVDPMYFYPIWFVISIYIVWGIFFMGLWFDGRKSIV